MLPKTLPSPTAGALPDNKRPALAGLLCVKRTGIEPVTSGLQTRLKRSR
jgi:hypothetical protein